MVLPTKDLTSNYPVTFDYSERLGKVNEDEAFAMLTARVGTTDQGRDPLQLALHKTWFVGITYLLNLRTATYLETLADIDPNFLPRDTSYSANHILHYVMFQVARLAGIMPEYEVLPHTADHDDTFAAEVGEAFLRYLGKRQKINYKRLEFCWWLVSCGHSFIYNDWDPSMGPKIIEASNPFDGRPMDISRYSKEDLQNLRSLGGVKDKRTGDLTKRVVSPFEVTVPRGFRGPDLDRCPWLVIEEEVDPGWIWDRYPAKARGLEVDDFATSTNTFYYKRIAHLVNRYGFALPSSGIEASEMVTIRTLWIPPSGWAPKGFFVRATRTKVLEWGDHPMVAAGIDTEDPEFHYMRYPVSGARYAHCPGRYWGQGLIEQLLGPQAQYNIAADQLVRQSDRMAAPTVISPDDNDLSIEGDVYRYNALKGKPELWSAPAIGQGQTMVKEQAMADMRLLSSQSDPARDFPTQTRSGNMIAMMQETDETAVGPTVGEIWACYEDVARRDLTLTWKLWEVERLIQIVGQGRSMKAMAFKGSELNGNVFVEIIPQSMRLKSRAAAMEQVMNMTQLGLLQPMNPDHLEVAIDAIEFKGMEHLFKAMRAHRERARQEEFMFQKPQDAAGGNVLPWPDVDDHDDDLAHLKSHITFKMSDTYQMLPVTAKMAFDAHIQKHEMAIAEAMMAQQAMVAPGAGPAGPGGGSPPAEKGEPSPPNQQAPQQQEAPGAGMA